MSSIALVVLDTVRKDAFDDHFDWLPGEHYHNAYSTANWTGPAHASLFTGEYGSAVGVSSKSRGLDCDRTVLPETLSAAGYTTRAWSANPNISYTTNFDRGFDEFVGRAGLQQPDRDLLDIDRAMADHADSSRLRRYLGVLSEAITGDCDTLASIAHGARVATGRTDGSMADSGASAVLEQLRATDFGDREFAFLNLMEAHTPYDPPASFGEFQGAVDMPFGEAYFGVDNPERVRRGYDAAVAYLSEVYEEIFAVLDASFDYVITVSDHGELLGEHGMWNHVSGVYPELTHVPLVVSGPEFSGDCDRLVNLLDLYATILRLAGAQPRGEGTPLSDSVGHTGPYLAEYRGPFERSLEKAQKRGVDLEQFDRDLFALIGEHYYQYQDYDGWVHRGRREHEPPEPVLDAKLDDYQMRTVEAGNMNIDRQAREQLADLGYL